MKTLLRLVLLIAAAGSAHAQTIGSTGGGTPGNPTATAGAAAVNGSATTYMRSDAAPAVALSTASTKGISSPDNTTLTASGGIISCTVATNTQIGCVKPDGTTITISGGTLSSTGGTSGANPTATAGPTAVNGSATTFMRSDGAPAVQKGTNAVFGLAEGDGQTITLVAGVASRTSPNNTFTASHTVASTDMGGTIVMNVSGGGTLTIPAISGTVFAAGMQATVVNYSASTMAVSTTPTVNSGGGCVTGTGVPAGDSWFLVSNGTTLDCTQTVNTGSGVSSGNPTATAGPAAINGSASTYMRSDAAPAVQKATNAQFGLVEGDGQTLSCTAGVCGSIAVPNTFTASHTVAATDMGGVVVMNVTGGGTLTIPAISSTVLANGMTVSVINYSASTATVSTTPTVNSGGGCVSGTGIPSGATWNIVSNGTTLDCNQTVATGGGGGGTVTTTGSPASGNLTKFSGATSITNGDLAGDVTTSGTLTTTLATVNSNVGTFGDATHVAQVTVNAKGLTTAASSVAIAGLPLTQLATQAANTVVANVSGSTAAPTAASLPSCTDTGGNHLNYTNGTGFSCGSSASAPLVSTTSGGNVTLSGNQAIYFCTSSCNVTLPVPVAGAQFCIVQGNNATSTITLVALGSSAMYQNTAMTAYGTAGTGTLSNSGSAAHGDKVCVVGADSTHYNTVSYNGTWTAS